MARSKNNALSKLVRKINAAGEITSSAIASTVSLGADTYTSADLLPTSGNNIGDQAFVTDNNRLYIWAGTGWYNVALINRAPTFTSIEDSDGNTTPFSLAIDGTPTTITLVAQDSDGTTPSYSYVADSDFAGLATITGSGTEYTITPLSQDSASTSSGTITFKATDGVNIASSVNTFRLNFVSALWDETLLSIGANSTNGLDNSTFVDRSTNAHTVTTSGSPVQTAFHPYLDNWSVEFDNTDNHYIRFDNSGNDLYNTNDDITIECWIYPRTTTVTGIFDGTAGVTAGLRQYRANRVGRQNGGTDLDVEFTITQYKWQHFAFVADSTNFRVYIDGVEQNTITNPTYAATNTFDIGTINEGGSGRFNGYISDFRITKSAVYTADFTPPSRLEEITNTTLLACNSNRFINHDTSYTGTITVNANPEISAFNPFGQGSEYAVGENKGSMFLDGTDDALDISDGQYFSFGTSDFTIQGWVYSDGSDYFTLWQNGQVNLGIAGTERYFFGVDTGGGISAARHSGAGSLTAPTGTVQLNAWQHIALTRQSGTLRIYVNGVQANSSTVWNSFSIGNYPHAIGFRTTPNWAGGYISDVRVDASCLYPDGTTFAVPTSSVGATNSVLHLAMDNAGVFDKTGNNTLQLYGDASTSTTETKYATTSIGLDGSGDYVFLPNSSTALQALPQGSSWTIDFWGYITTTGSHLLGINTESAGSNAYLILGTSVNLDGASSSNTIPLNQWVHHAIVYEASSGDLTYYRDGTQIYQRAGRTTLTYPLSDCVIGFGTEFDAPSGGGPGNYTNGYMEDINIIAAAKYTTDFTPPVQTQGRQYQAES